MPDMIIGVKVDESDAKQSFNSLDDVVKGFGEIAKKASDTATKALKKTSVGVKAIQKSVGKMGVKAKKAFSEWSIEAQALGKQLKGPISTGIKTATVAITAMGVAMAVVIKQGVETSNTLNNISETTSLSTKNVSAFYTAIKKGGGDIDGAKDSLNDFVERIGDARSGSGAFQEAFNALGVDINGPIDQAMTDAIKNLSDMENQSDALFRGIEVFGNEYKLIAEQVRSGSDIMAESPLFSPAYIKASEELTKKMRSMKVTFMTTLNKGLEPFITTMADFFKNIKSEQVEKFGETVITIFKNVLIAGGYLITGLDTVFSGLNMLVSGLVTMMLKSGGYILELFGNLTQGASDVVYMLNKLPLVDIDTTGIDAVTASIRETQATLYGAAAESSKATTQINKDFEDRTAAVAKLVVKLTELGVKQEETDSGGGSGGGKVPGKVRTGKSYTQIKMEEDIAIRAESDALQEANREKEKEDAIAQTEKLQQLAKDTAWNAINGALDVANSIAQIRQNARDKELQDLQEQQKKEMRGKKMSDTARLVLERKFEKQQDAIREEGAKKQRAMQVTQAIAGMASGIAAIWSTHASLGPAGMVLAGINTAILTGVTIAQIAAIKSAESHATGGVIGDGAGASGGPDDTIVSNMRKGEMVITASEQANLSRALKTEGLGGGGGQPITLNIENFRGDEEDLDRLEDRLYSLQSSGRFQFTS